jgi:hypothetical protein
MDVFIAYSSHDEARVRTIVEWLRREGLDVWVAYERPAGLDWDKEIDSVLAVIPCVFAVWSPASVASPEVKGEARAAMARNALVTASLDKQLPPRSFTHLHAIDLSGLAVDEQSPRTAQVLEGIRSKLHARAGPSQPARSAPPEEAKPASIRPRVWAGIAGAILLAVAAVVVVALQSASPRSCDTPGVVTLRETFATDTRIKESVVCIPARRNIRVANGARLDVESDTLILEGGARFDGRGEPGAAGRPGSDGPRHVHQPPKVLGVAICGRPPPQSDYSGQPGGPGGSDQHPDSARAGRSGAAGTRRVRRYRWSRRRRGPGRYRDLPRRQPLRGPGPRGASRCERLARENRGVHLR